MAPTTEARGLDNLAFDMDEEIKDKLKAKEEQQRGGSRASAEDKNKLAYCVTDVPPWYLCIVLSIQHYLTAFGGIFSIPLILSDSLCLQHDGLTQSRLINTIFFVSGLCTMLQVTFGVRLPILQGGTFALLTPTVAMLSMPEWQCPAWTQNATLVDPSSPVFREVWQSRLRALQGSVMVASLLQIVAGFTGIIGLLMRFIGPLTIAPTITLIGLSVFQTAGAKAGSHWGISAMTAALIILFSQYLHRVPIPVPAYNRSRKFHISKFRLFQVVPVLLGISISWLVCYLLTINNVLPSNPAQYGHQARTDLKGNVVSDASWFTFPYPGQWGVPTVNLAGVLGIMAGIICSMAESVGDYHACAKLSGAPPPPKHAINRGIGVEGLGSLLAGAFGTGNGTTSFSENIAVLDITKVGSRMVIFTSGAFMVLMGILGKVAAIFTTIPEPVVGGMFLVMFGVISAAGVSNLQFTDLNSSRTLFIFGFSLFSAMVIPDWIHKYPESLNTGVPVLDQVITILLTTNMFVGGFLGFVLDNTIPGTRQERGFVWEKEENAEGSKTLVSEEVYELPFGITSFLSSYSCVRFIPFCPWKGENTDEGSVVQHQPGEDLCDGGEGGANHHTYL